MKNCSYKINPECGWKPHSNLARPSSSVKVAFSDIQRIILVFYLYESSPYFFQSFHNEYCQQIFLDIDLLELLLIPYDCTPSMNFVRQKFLIILPIFSRFDLTPLRLHILTFPMKIWEHPSLIIWSLMHPTR